MIYILYMNTAVNKVEEHYVTEKLFCTLILLLSVIYEILLLHIVVFDYVWFSGQVSTTKLAGRVESTSVTLSNRLFFVFAI